MACISISIAASTWPPDAHQANILLGTVVQNSVSVPAYNGQLQLVVETPVFYAGTYTLPHDVLEAGPSNLVQPQVGSDAAAASLAVSGLWAHAEAAGPVTLSYQWLRNGIVIAGATQADHILQPEDFGQTLQLRETAFDTNGKVHVLSDAIQIVGQPFSIVVDTLGSLLIQGNDGRAFVIDAEGDYYDGTYSVPVGALENAPLVLLPPILEGAAPISGDVLNVVSPLVAYDPDLGPLTVTYATTGAGVLATNTDNAATYTAVPADVGATVTVTATIAQDGNSVQIVSNGVEVAAPAGITWDQIAPPLANTLVDVTHAFTVDLSSYGAGDTIVLTTGPADYSSAIMINGKTATRIAESGGNSGSRVTLYTFVLSGQGAAVADVEVTLPSPNRCLLNIIGVSGAALVETALGFDQNRIFAPVSLSGTTVASENLMLAIVHGGSAVFDGPGLSWSGVGEDLYSGLLNNDQDGIAVASASNVPQGSYSVSVDQDASTMGRFGAALLTFS